MKYSAQTNHQANGPALLSRRSALLFAAALGLEALAFGTSCSEQEESTDSGQADSNLHVEDQKVDKNKKLVIGTDPRIYFFDDFQKDADILLSRYSDLMTVESIGTTVDGRDLTLFVVGSAEASNKIFINAGIHAREYLVTQLVTKQLAAFLKNLSKNKSYKGTSYSELMEDTALFVLPFANPDGTSLAQNGLKGLDKAELRETVEKIARREGSEPTDYYCSQWKANANGVDLNRNFNIAFESVEGPSKPASKKYRGESPLCEVESKAIAGLTKREDFSCTLSYHTRGEVVYWAKTGNEEVDHISKGLNDLVAELTGFKADDEPEKVDPGVYKDWGCSIGIPSLTIECGTGNNPVDPDQFPSTYERNKNIFEEVILYMKKQQTEKDA